MYNEDERSFCRTMYGVMKNIAQLCEMQESPSKLEKGGIGWREDAWKHIVVCIVSDGRGKINEKTCDVLTALGVYQEDIIKVCHFINSLPPSTLTNHRAKSRESL